MTVGVSSSGSGGRPGVWSGLAGPASGRREITVRASSGVIGSGGRSGGVSGGGGGGSGEPGVQEPGVIGSDGAGGGGIAGSYAGGGGIDGSYAGGGSGWTGASCDSGGEPRPRGAPVGESAAAGRLAGPPSPPPT